MALAGEVCRKVEEESGRLANERLSLVMELGAMKDEFVAFREKATAEIETMEAEFNSSGDTLFNYGYGCCAFTHNICRSKLHISDGMSNPSVPLTPNFFANLRCPPSVPSAAPALDIAMSGEDEHPGNSLIAVGEEVVLPIDPLIMSDGEVEDAVATRV